MAGGFLLEIRRQTQSALLVIREAELPGGAVDVSIGAGWLALRGGGSCGSCAVLPPGLGLLPASCRGLSRRSGHGLQLHMRLSRPPPSADLVYNLRESLKPQTNYIFYCQSCGDIIEKDRNFLRVLPLPSADWSALVEEWCCHPNPFARSTLHPQPQDCFLGDTFLLLNSGSAAQTGSILNSKGNSRVFCKRCKRVLGEPVSPDTIKYYLTELVIQPSQGTFNPMPRSQFLQSIIAQCLMELSSAKSTFRFTVKGDDGKIYILIWLLNSDTLLVESLGSSSSPSVVTPFGDTFLPSSGPVETWNAVKVLYQPCIKGRNKDLADAWESDLGVQPLKFPSETCLEFLLILALSSSSLPPSLRHMNSFQVAFLKM